MANRCVTAVPPGVDGAVGVDQAHWYVAIVTARHEKSVAERLAAEGIASMVATQKEMRLWQNGRRKLIDRVVIPNVVFIRCTERERLRIVGLPSILHFMVNRASESGGLRKPVAIIPPAEISRLQFMLGQSETPVNFNPTVYKVNDNVRVIRGHLCGLEGQIMKNADGTHTLTVGIGLLGGATVTIDPHDVEKI